MALKTVAAAQAVAKRTPWIFAGILAGLGTPGMYGWWLTLPAFVVFFALARGRQLGFLSGWLFGFAYFLTSLYWITYVVHVFGGVSAWIAWFPLAALAAYCGLFAGCAAWSVSLLGTDRYRLLALPLALVAFDVLRGELLTGFPWTPFGVSLIAVPKLAAPAAWIGSHGLSLLLLLLCAGCAEWLWVAARKQPGDRRLVLLPATALVWAILVYAAKPSRAPEGKPYSFAVIQGNVAQDVKWDEAMRRTTLNIYEDLTRRATADGPLDLVVWPETAMPFFFQLASPERDWIQRVIQHAGSRLLFGAPAYRIDSDTKEPSLYNRAYFVDAKGDLVGHYDKTHLVPFGEYVPLQRVLFFVTKFVNGIGEFRPGDGRKTLVERDLSLGVLICYEAIFPFEVAEYARSGAKVLVQITNDAWFGDTAAPEQHLAMSQMRALETGLPVLRAANTGISAWIDPSGAVQKRLGMERRGYLLGEAHPGTPTPFARAAGVLHVGWILCSLGFAAVCVLDRWQRRQRKDG